MKITIQTISGFTRVISVEPTTTIREIKQQLYALEGIEADQQHILLRGSIVQDSSTIEAANITEGQVLHMVINLIGGY